MASYGSAATLLDFAKRMDPDGKIQKIAEVLAQSNEILDDMLWKEGNLPTGHKSTIRTGYPSVTWRQLYQGVMPSKSTTAQVTDTTGMLEAYAEVDKALSELNGNTAEWRLSEDKAFLEQMNQTMAATLFYGDTRINPERFTGLAPRFTASSTSVLNSGYNIVKGSASSTSTLTSIWLVGWGENTVFGIVPKGSMAGFQHQDLGEQTLLDTNQGRYQGYRTHYKWDMGLCVRDWRYVSRVSNIQTTGLTPWTNVLPTGDTLSSDDLPDLMVQAIEKLPNLNDCKPAFYVSRTVKTWLRRQMIKGTVYQLTEENIGGKPCLTFCGVPVRRVDQILSTESATS